MPTLPPAALDVTEPPSPPHEPSRIIAGIAARRKRAEWTMVNILVGIDATSILQGAVLK
jgi:hypothetical protein